MPALLAVGRGSAPVLLEEQREALLRRPEVLFGIHRSQHLVVRDAAVERVDEAHEGGVPADLVVEAERRLAAGWSVMSSSRRSVGVGRGIGGRRLRSAALGLPHGSLGCGRRHGGRLGLRWIRAAHPLRALDARRHDRRQRRQRDAELVDRVLQAHAQFAGDVVLGVGAGLDDETDDERVAGDRLQAPHLGLLEDARAPLRVLGQLLRRVEHRLLDHVDVGIRRHGEIDDHPRPALRQIADAEDLAVADVPERAVHIADVGHAHAHVLHDAGGESEVDDIADSDLVLGDDEDAVEDVLHDVLRPEAETGADRGRQQRERAERGRGEHRRRSSASATITIVTLTMFCEDRARACGCAARPARTASGDRSSACVSSTFALFFAPLTMRFTTRRMTNLRIQRG